MSYPPPPPPGQGGPGPYPPGGQQPPPPGANPYGPSPYGPPPKKDTTLWWILGTIAVVVLLCCVGVCVLFGGVASFVGDEIESSSDSWSSSYSGTQAETATPVDEGEEATDENATILSGWSADATGVAGLSMRNDGSSYDMLKATFYFMDGDEVVGTATCTSTFLDPGETDSSVSCLPSGDVDAGLDEIRFASGS